MYGIAILKEKRTREKTKQRKRQTWREFKIVTVNAEPYRTHQPHRVTQQPKKTEEPPMGGISCH